MERAPVMGFACMVAVAAGVTAVVGWILSGFAQMLAGFVLGGLTVMVAAVVACNTDFE